jgi:hypothetical protein
VVLDAAHNQRPHLVLTSDAAEVGPEALLQLRLDDRAAFPGGEHAMHEATDEGVHGFLSFLSSLTGRVLFLLILPSDKSLGYSHGVPPGQNSSALSQRDIVE